MWRAVLTLLCTTTTTIQKQAACHAYTPSTCNSTLSPFLKSNQHRFKLILHTLRPSWDVLYTAWNPPPSPRPSVSAVISTERQEQRAKVPVPILILILILVSLLNWSLPVFANANVTRSTEYSTPVRQCTDVRGRSETVRFCRRMTSSTRPLAVPYW